MRTFSDPEKKTISNFLKGTPPSGATSGHFEDAQTGKEVPGGWMAYQRGGFTWTSRDLYHFEKYDLELTPEFRAYALAN